MVTKYKFKDVKFSETSYEGRQTVTFSYDTYSEEVIIPKGSYLFLTDQRSTRISYSPIGTKVCRFICPMGIYESDIRAERIL